MIIEHLESYEIAMIIWCFLFMLVGIQGLIAIFLEGEAHLPGRHAAKPASWGVLGVVALLTAGNIWLSWKFVEGLFQGSSQESLSQLVAAILLLLAALVGIYRRYFIDDVVIAQDRNDGVPW